MATTIESEVARILQSGDSATKQWAALQKWGPIVPDRQKRVIHELLSARDNGDAMFYIRRYAELCERWTYCPKTFETHDLKAEQKLAQFHYFGEFHWYVVEKDRGDAHDRTSQHQAWGLTCGFERDFGYISLEELRRENVEFDFHFTPKPIYDIFAQHART